MWPSTGSSRFTVDELVIDITLYWLFTYSCWRHAYYQPANEIVGRLCFYSCLWFCSQGGCLPQCMLGYHTPGSRHPREQAPPWSRQPLGAGTPTQQAPQHSRHPNTAGTPTQQAPQHSRHPIPGTPPSGAVHAGRYGQQAGSMHPTGMQSC